MWHVSNGFSVHRTKSHYVSGWESCLSKVLHNEEGISMLRWSAYTQEGPVNYNFRYGAILISRNANLGKKWPPPSPCNAILGEYLEINYIGSNATRRPPTPYPCVT